MTATAIPHPLLFGALMASTPDHVYFKDLEFRFVWVSDSLARALGRSIEDIVGRTDADFFDEARAHAYRDAELHMVQTGEPIIDQVTKHTWPDGRDTWSLNVAMPLRDNGGEIVGVWGTNKDITAAKVTEFALEQANRDLREMSRLAGMAEAATGVLHNVGNVLNSVNVSTHLLAEGLRKLKIDRLSKVALLLREHASDPAEFLTRHPQGSHVSEFLELLHQDLSGSQQQMLKEVGALEENIAHIREIVSVQQSYATMGGLVEDCEVEAIVEDALRLNQGAFQRHGIRIERAFEPLPKIRCDRGKILQILHNLLRNAKYAVDEADIPEKTISIRIEAGPGRTVRIIVQDNGVGIAPEHLTAIFQHGFTTRKGGHGFGLHSAANAAQSMRGALTGHSDGLGHGARFVLELPGSTGDRPR